jgi:NAD(P)-dependent dehydrogenase (short-subunit alcohol dehydrogenase family)
MGPTLDYTGQVVLVTGATKGVGRGIAQSFAEAGATIAVCARRSVPDLPAGWTFIAADLRDGTAAMAVVDQVVEQLGRIDVLINNAGGTPPVDTAEASPNITEKVVQINLLASIFCSQRANHFMQAQPQGGSIINISSVCSTRPSPNAAAYGAAKAGLNNYSMTAAMEWAPQVRVNTVMAGMVLTEQSYLFYGDDEGIANVGSTVPLGRLAQPGEIGDICLFLGSSLASYVTGATVAAHGGGERPPFLGAANA